MITRNLFVNSLWLIFDKSFILIGGLITTLIVARYLSPQEMGLINYSILIAGFCTALSQWGAKYTVFEAASKGSNKADDYVTKTLLPRVSIYLIVWSFFSLYLYYNEEFTDFIFVSILSLSMIFMALDVYQYIFDGHLNSKFNTYATFLGRAFSIIVRLLLVHFGFDIWYFLIPLMFEGVIILGAKFTFYSYSKKVSRSLDGFSKINLEYFNNGLPIVIFSILSLFYDKINLLLIKEYLTFSDVAVFTMAKTLAMAWTFLPMSFSTSIITKELSNLNGKYLIQAYRVILVVSTLPLLVTYFYPDIIVSYTLGGEYNESAGYLFWLCLLAMFSCLNITTNRVLASMDKRGKNFLIRKSIILSIISVIAGIKLIGQFGIIGALLNASLIMFIDLFILNFIFDYKYFSGVLRGILDFKNTNKY